jgi:hypothetical protein
MGKKFTEETVSNDDLSAEAVAADESVKPEKKARKKKEVDPNAPKKQRIAKLAFDRSAVITVLVDKNPKRAKSAAFARFEGYLLPNMVTVDDALLNGVTAADLHYDVGHGFISIEGFPKAA